MAATQVPSYAKRLSHNPNKGVVGLAEVFDSDRTKSAKLKKLAGYLNEAKRVVVLTGAGISTSAGIADFRGPNGVWTKEETRSRKKSKTQRGTRQRAQSKEKQTTESGDDVAEVVDDDDSSSSFQQARPTRTHDLLTKLHELGKVHFVISQNVDGLHLRSGFPRGSLIELHGNVFLERCVECKHEVFHELDLGGVGCKETGRKCIGCGGAMHDTVLDWDTPIDEEEMSKAEEEVSLADLIVCLGTSLRIVPAAELPLLVGTRRTDDIEPRICIINLQKTPLDNNADLVIHCKVDECMEFIYNDLLQRLDKTREVQSSSPTLTRCQRPKRTCSGLGKQIQG